MYPNSFLAPIPSNEPWLSPALALLASVLKQVQAEGMPLERTILLGFSQGACLALEFAARHAQRYGGMDDRRQACPRLALLRKSPQKGGMLVNEFRYTSYAQEIIFGPDSLAQLGDAVERFSWRRLLLCSTGSQRRNGHITAIENVLGDRLVATFESVAPHVPDAQVAEVSSLAYDSKIDALIGLGGMSIIY